jgi:hypothetical protein
MAWRGRTSSSSPALAGGLPTSVHTARFKLGFTLRRPGRTESDGQDTRGTGVPWGLPPYSLLVFIALPVGSHRKLDPPPRDALSRARSLTALLKAGPGGCALSAQCAHQSA